MNRQIPLLFGAVLRRSVPTALTVLLLTAGTASAQWFKILLPGTPRTADGEPDLNAPVTTTADGRPDLSGIWRAAQGRYLGNLAADEDQGVPPTSSDTYFPQVVDSGGWSTQMVLFSGIAGQASSGTLSFIDQTGRALGLSVTESP